MKQKKVLLTGCSTGIGLAIAKRLQADGYEIYGLSRHTKKNELENLSSVRLYPCDLRNPEHTEEVLRKIIKDSSGIDIAINNAGIGNFGEIDSLSLSAWNEVMAVNLTTAYLVMHHVLPGMKKQNFGKIISISSDADSFSFAGAGAYCASKAGLSALSNCVRKEVSGHTISVTTIAPGRVDTNFNHKKKGDRPHSLAAEDIAEQVAHLLTLSERCEVEKISLNSTLEKELH